MKLTKRVTYQCGATVTPGEYVIDRWDNQRCGETSPYSMVRCEDCSQLFCYMHWPKHEHMEVTDETQATDVSPLY